MLEASPSTYCSFVTSTATHGTPPCSDPPSLPSSCCSRQCTLTSNWSALPFVLIEILVVKRCRRPCITYERWRLTISSTGVSDVFATLDATMSRISDSKVVMFTPLVLRLSIPTRRDAERRYHVN
jgi:hypothetical protein